jgi:hypothetical protein
VTTEIGARCQDKNVSSREGTPSLRDEQHIGGELGGERMLASARAQDTSPQILKTDHQTNLPTKYLTITLM